MAVNVSEIKFIIFQTRGKNIDQNIRLIFDDNEPNEHSPELIYKLERAHKNIKPENRSYKLLSIHFDEILSFDHHTKYLCSKLINHHTALAKLITTSPHCTTVLLIHTFCSANQLCHEQLYTN
jgi:hypothetical protein